MADSSCRTISLPSYDIPPLPLLKQKLKTVTNSPTADWRRQPGRPRIMWQSSVQKDLKLHHLMLPEAADFAQNCPLWRMMLMYKATQS